MPKQIHRQKLVMIVGLSVFSVGLELFIFSTIYSSNGQPQKLQTKQDYSDLAIDRIYPSRHFTNYTVQDKHVHLSKGNKDLDKHSEDIVTKQLSKTTHTSG